MITRFFKSIRNMITPNRVFAVQMQVINKLDDDRVVAVFPVTVEARHKWGARARAKKALALEAGRAVTVAKRVNGHAV